jgi:hypothetical protein
MAGGRAASVFVMARIGFVMARLDRAIALSIVLMPVWPGQAGP